MPESTASNGNLKPRLLDLFCGAGGAARGYQLAGFEVTGIDINPQPRYPGELFIQGDALKIAEAGGFDAIHASPPCQRYSFATTRANKRNHPDLLPATRELLVRLGLPWVIENVPGAPMRSDFVLCGSQFGLQVIRHRQFEMSPRPDHVLLPPCAHPAVALGVYGTGTPTWHREKLGRNVSMRELEAAMGIGWMTRKELSQSIPPAYTKFIGNHLLCTIRQAELSR